MYNAGPMQTPCQENPSSTGHGEGGTGEPEGLLDENVGRAKEDDLPGGSGGDGGGVESSRVKKGVRVWRGEEFLEGKPPIIRAALVADLAEGAPGFDLTVCEGFVGEEGDAAPEAFSWEEEEMRFVTEGFGGAEEDLDGSEVFLDLPNGEGREEDGKRVKRTGALHSVPPGFSDVHSSGGDVVLGKVVRRDDLGCFHAKHRRRLVG